ncbi:TlpA family protein disulfide reductase [Vallicoccus soli]|uniref:TlpA family protein disulfide reductase n=1 Tax=Vallicoccus soli TaxID=2339232 RepID=A0A3A3YZJ5_9ACTN|nr:TlpA family protein disulfide reductase [Vallicoccus soli]
MLAGCGGGGPDTGDADTGFVSGDSSLVTFTPAEEEPVELAGETLDGEDLDLAALRGKVVVLNVWGSWCPPCRAEAPALERVSADLRDDGVAFVGINTKDERVSAQGFEERFLSYPSLWDPAGRGLLALADAVPPNAIPSTLVLDREGRPVSAVLGEVDEPRLRELLAPLVPAAAGPA